MAAVEPHRGRQLRVAQDLVLPVRQHAGGTDDEEVRRSVGPEMAQHRQCFNGLAETHLVAEDGPLLDQREFCSEGLVAAEGRAEQRHVEVERLDPPRDVRR